MADDGHAADGSDGATDGQAWYWGVVVRIDGADDLLRRVASVRRAAGVVPQRPGTGHVTLFYAPVRSADAVGSLAAAAAPAVARTAPFSVRLGGFGEFVTPGRVVAWIGVEDGLDRLREVRQALCECDLDTLAHPFVPHCTLAYGDVPDEYTAVRPEIEATVDAARLDVDVDALWIAGFPRGGHPAEDLVYRRRLPLNGRGTTSATTAGPSGRRST